MFLTLDADLSYLHVKVDDQDVDEKIFATNHGLYKYIMMLFRTKNVPAAIWLAMDIILASVKRQHRIVYANGIIVFSKTEKELLKHTDETLLLQENAGTTIKLNNWFRVG